MNHIKQIFLLTLFLAGIISMATYPNVYTITLAPMINFIVITFVYRDDIYNYNYNQAIRSKRFWNSVYWAVVSAAVLQAIGNFVVMHVFKVEPYSLSFVMYIIAAPILSTIFSSVNEEIIYRKIIFGGLDKRFGFLFSSIVSSLAFMVSHYNRPAWLGYFAFAMVMSYFYKRTGNLAVVIIAHMILNLFFFLMVTYKGAQ